MDYSQWSIYHRNKRSRRDIDQSLLGNAYVNRSAILKYAEKSYYRIEGASFGSRSHAVTKLTIHVLACRCARKMILFLFPRFFGVTDVVTSWRHVMTSQNLNYLSQLRDVLENWFFFVSMNFLVNEFENIIKFLIVGCRDVITSCHNVTIPDFWYLSLEMCWKVDFFISMDFWS